MSLKPQDAASPAPWSPREPWSPPPGAYPPSPAPLPRSTMLAHHSLSAAVRARKDDYVRKKAIKIKIGTWNVAAIHGTEKDLGAWFVHGLGIKGLSQDLAGLSEETGVDLTKDEDIESVEDQERRMARKKTTVPKNDVSAVPSDGEIGLYVLGLQEVVDVTSVTEAMRPYTDQNPAKKWKHALKAALPSGYELVAEQQLLGMLILIYAAPDVAPSISSISATSVGTGLGGYLGNKGAVSVRLLLGETTRFTFINCHLAAGADQNALQRRIWDTNQILTRTRFAPVSLDGEVVEGSTEMIGDEDFAFWFGDLNYRLDDIPGEDVRRLLLLHTRNEYDIVNKSKRRIDSELGYIKAPSAESLTTTHSEYSDAERPAIESTAEPPLDPESDPASLQTTLQSLLPHDQLTHQKKLGKAFHDGWREGDIHFLPTYKYDVGSVGMFDSGEKKRSPSWCDRILYRTRKDRESYEERLAQQEAARKKDADMQARGLDQAAAEQDVLFAYDPDTDGQAYGDDYDELEDAAQGADLVRTKDGYEDTIRLDNYISHQRVLSSDHKPLDAVFTLTYDTVIPELKAKVHSEVAKDFDKAENEGRPNVTLVVDHHTHGEFPETDGSTESADMNVVNFGAVRYGVKKVRAVTVANTGQTTASFSFVERPSEDNGKESIGPPWLDIYIPEFRLSMTGCEIEDAGTMKDYRLLPGETITVEISINFSEPSFVYKLNEGTAKIDDVLVLRVSDGRDHFIPIHGVWVASSFYRTLDDLVYAPEGGVRNLSKDGMKPVPRSAPPELFSLTDAIPSLLERSIAEWDMLHEGELPPWRYDAIGDLWPFDRHTWTLEEGEERESLLASVREALDTSSDIDQHLKPELPCIVRLELLAETLIAFLSSLRDGIITTSIWAEAEGVLVASEKSKVSHTCDDFHEMIMGPLSELPVHSVSFSFLTIMLTRMINELSLLAVDAAPASKTSTSTRSRSSTLSSMQPSIYASEPTSIPSSDDAPSRASFFPILRRKRTDQGNSTSTSENSTHSTAVEERRKALASAYATVFAPILIRSEKDAQARGKEKRLLGDRKRKVLKSFINPDKS